VLRNDATWTDNDPCHSGETDARGFAPELPRTLRPALQTMHRTAHDERQILPDDLASAREPAPHALEILRQGRPRKAADQGIVEMVIGRGGVENLGQVDLRPPIQIALEQPIFVTGPVETLQHAVGSLIRTAIAWTDRPRVTGMVATLSAETIEMNQPDVSPARSGASSRQCSKCLHIVDFSTFRRPARVIVGPRTEV
jgi:hypothetical protein